MKYTAHEHLVPFETVAPGTYTDETEDGAGVDKTSAREALVVASMSAVGTSFQINIQDSPDDVTYADFPGVQENGPISPVVTEVGVHVGRIDLEGANKYVRAQLIAVGAVVGYVMLTLSHERKLPVVQENDLLFNIQ